MQELVMTVSESMKNPIKPVDEEAELAEMTVSPKFRYPHARDDVSFTPIETEDFEKEGPDFSDIMHRDSKNHEQDAEIKSRIIESGSVFESAECGSSFGAALRLEDNLSVDIQQSSLNDMSTDLALEADENMSERSPSAVVNNSAFSDGPLTRNCSGAWNLGGEKVVIVFYPDYIDYCGTHYLSTVVNFSRSFVDARSIDICGDEINFQIHLEIEDIVKIESQWSTQCQAGIINIHFISNDGASAPRLLELTFPAVDPDWYQKQEAIVSLDLRYKELWNVILDTGMEKISPLPKGKTMMRTFNYFPKFDKPFEGLIYPKGDPDAVSISKRDADLLLPETFVNDTIIDFYIKYLKSRQNVVDITKFHFFNSFFFRKLADMDKDPSSAFDGKSAFKRVRKWTRKINLLEKDFIFIPVNYNYHWSLIVICYFGEVVSYKDDEDGKSLRVPCILHMDSLVGNHVGLKDLLQSYLWEEWKERHKETSEDLHSNFKNLKFIPLELPQQQNSYDCGLFLLHYVELFLEEVPTNFSIYQITSSSNFLQEDWFPSGEASMKRTRVERLINDLLVETLSEDCPPFDGNEMHCSPGGLKAIHGYGNAVGLSINSNSTSACGESSLHQVDQGIELTLLPASSTRSTQCNRTSGVVLKELFKQASVPEPFNDASWGALGSRASLPEEEVEDANDCLVPEELTEPVFHHIDGVTIEEPVFPYSPGYFRLNTLHQPTPDHVVSSPLTSGSDTDDDIVEVQADEDEKCIPVEAVTVNHDELDNHKYSSPEKNNEPPNAEKSCTPVEINDLNVDESLPIKRFSQEETNWLQRNHVPAHEGLSVGPALASGDKSGVVLVSVIPCDEARPDSDVQELVLELDEQRSAKRMRIETDCGEDEVCTNNLSKDLHL